MRECTRIAGQQTRSLWQFLALSDPEFESSDIVEMNLAVAKEIPSLRDLDISHYCRIVDLWAQQFARWLEGAERAFHNTPWKWKSDIRFFRVGMLAGFLGHEIGIRYKEEQKHVHSVRYTNPSELFLNGLIDTKEGNCATMPTLHAAIARRMGWPVSLACARSHFLSRFDDGEVCYNIEATATHPGSFVSDPDEVYIKRFELPQRAITCGSDLRRLTAREMIGVFIFCRARHYSDTKNWAAADQDHALARVLFPSHRQTYIATMIPMLYRGCELFEPGELGHPDSVFQELAPIFASPLQPCNNAPPGVHVITMTANPKDQNMPQAFSAAQIGKEYL